MRSPRRPRPLNLRGALAKSCNDYMIEHATAIGLVPIADVLRSAGIGRKTGVELPEIAGTFPSNASKKRSHRNAVRWNSYDTGLLSIGQGVITLSPLQAAVYTAALANGGKISDRTWSGKWSTPMGTCSTNASRKS